MFNLHIEGNTVYYTLIRHKPIHAIEKQIRKKFEFKNGLEQRNI